MLLDRKEILKIYVELSEVHLGSLTMEFARAIEREVIDRCAQKLADVKSPECYPDSYKHIWDIALIEAQRMLRMEDEIQNW